MAIIPTVRCTRMKSSIAFYTRVLDFEWVDGDDDQSDPSFSMLMREGDSLILSSHRGDGTFGQAIVVQTNDIEALFRKFRTRGLRTPGNPDAPKEVHEGPIDQTWGTRESYVKDPDREYPTVYAATERLEIRGIRETAPIPESGSKRDISKES